MQCILAAAAVLFYFAMYSILASCLSIDLEGEEDKSGTRGFHGWQGTISLYVVYLDMYIQ